MTRKTDAKILSTLAATLGRRGGQAKTAKKAAACRLNAAKAIKARWPKKAE